MEMPPAIVLRAWLELTFALSVRLSELASSREIVATVATPCASSCGIGFSPCQRDSKSNTVELGECATRSGDVGGHY